jgi:hypothetical protein
MVHTNDDNDDNNDNDDNKQMYLFVIFACTYCDVVHVVQKPWSRRHTNAQLQNKYKTVEVQWKTDGMGINTHRHHVETIQKNVECEKSEFRHLPSCNFLIYLKISRRNKMRTMILNKLQPSILNSIGIQPLIRLWTYCATPSQVTIHQIGK